MNGSLSLKPENVNRSGGGTSDLVWLIMSFEDLGRWLVYFERKEDYESCIEIRDEMRRRIHHCDDVTLKDSFPGSL